MNLLISVFRKGEGGLEVFFFLSSLIHNMSNNCFAYRIFMVKLKKINPKKLISDHFYTDDFYYKVYPLM